MEFARASIGSSSGGTLGCIRCHSSGEWGVATASRRTASWLTASELHSARNRALDVISWFHTMIAAKVYRSIATSPDDDSEDGGFDRDGSAKVALHGIDESHVAWLELAEHGVIGRREADSFIADLVWLGEALERARPNARAFIRPAFDEPDAVAGFLARNLS